MKRAQTDWLVEKATELGAARLIPVITQRTVAERVKLDRLRAIAIEAAEQCGRTRLPEIAEPVTLKQLLAEHDPERRLYFADEGGGEAAAIAFKAGAALMLIGPEGGFTDDERNLVRAAPNSVPISLGPRDPACGNGGARRACSLHGDNRRLAELVADLDVSRSRISETDSDHRIGVTAARIMEAEYAGGTGQERAVPFELAPGVTPKASLKPATKP